MNRLGIFVVALLVMASSTASPQQPASAHGTVGVPLSRWEPSSVAGLKDEKPRNTSIPSPDGRRVFKVQEGAGGKPVVTVSSNGKPVAYNIEYEHQAKLTWSPDSNAFYIEFTDAGSYDGWQVKLFMFEGNRVREFDDIGREAKLNLAHAFPPCRKGSSFKLDDCDLRKYAASLNVFVLKWIAPDTLAITVQVPCSSSYGPDNCNYRVFDISVPSGKILRTYSAKGAQQQFPECFKRQTSGYAEHKE